MKKKNKKESLVLGKILEKVASRIGATVLLEPEWGIIGRITFKSGRHSYFRYNSLDLNPLGSSEIARDKDYSNFFMQSMGYSIIPGSKTFFSDQWSQAIGSCRDIDAAYQYARKIGFPVIVKPNSGSQGIGISLVFNKQEFYRAIRAIFKLDRVLLVQKFVQGTDCRLVVLDKKVISAYQRIPLRVVGDGKSTIKKLLKFKQDQFVASSRDTQIKTDDPRILAKLKRQKLTFQSVPTKGQVVYLLDNANLSTGGDSVDIVNNIHADFKKLAIKLTRDMGLRLCGVDLMIEGNIDKKPETYWVLEINSAPGLDYYTRIGKAQKQIVEDLYFQVLKNMER